MSELVEHQDVDLRAFRFALDPTQDQMASLARHFGASRWAFNHALAQKMAAHQSWREQVAALVETGVAETVARKQVKVKVPTKPDIQLALNKVKGDDRTGADGLCSWFHEVSTYAFQSAFADADMAWKNWVSSLTGLRAGRKVGYPRFKKKGRSRDSVRIHHDVKKPTIRLDGYRHLVVPRVGSLRLHSTGKRMARYLARTGGRVQSVTLSKAGGRYYAAVLVQAPAVAVRPTRAQVSAGAVGVDLGVKSLAALSTGEIIANPRHLTAAQAKLTKAQRALSRTEKGSNRRGKAKARVAKLHHLVAERRSGALHQITKRLAAGHSAVAVEDLNVAGMTRSSKGTIEAPGKKVRQKAGLNRAILDVSFGEFRRQLDYKTKWYGSELAVVDRWLPSSKTCSACGAVKPKLDLSERTYRCGCGLVMDRDVNAARVILNASALNVAGDGPGDGNAAERRSGQPLGAPGCVLMREGPAVSGHLGGVIRRRPLYLIVMLVWSPVPHRPWSRSVQPAQAGVDPPREVPHGGSSVQPAQAGVDPPRSAPRSSRTRPARAGRGRSSAPASNVGALRSSPRRQGSIRRVQAHRPPGSSSPRRQGSIHHRRRHLVHDLVQPAQAGVDRDRRYPLSSWRLSSARRQGSIRPANLARRRPASPARAGRGRSQPSTT